MSGVGGREREKEREGGGGGGREHLPSCSPFSLYCSIKSRYASSRCSTFVIRSAAIFLRLFAAKTFREKGTDVMAD